MSLQGRRQCKHCAVNVIMRDGYTALATMVAHNRISMSIVTQVQAENFKRHEFTNMRICGVGNSSEIFQFPAANISCCVLHFLYM